MWLIICTKINAQIKPQSIVVTSQGFTIVCLLYVPVINFSVIVISGGRRKSVFEFHCEIHINGIFHTFSLN